MFVHLSLWCLGYSFGFDSAGSLSSFTNLIDEEIKKNIWCSGFPCPIKGMVVGCGRIVVVWMICDGRRALLLVWSELAALLVSFKESLVRASGWVGMPS